MLKWIWLRKNGFKNVPNTKLRPVIENPNPIPYAAIGIPIVARNGPKTKMRLKKPRESVPHNHIVFLQFLMEEVRAIPFLK
jgi:hypothetical protein